MLGSIQVSGSVFHYFSYLLKELDFTTSSKKPFVKNHSYTSNKTIYSCQILKNPLNQNYPSQDKFSSMFLI